MRHNKGVGGGGEGEGPSRKQKLPMAELSSFAPSAHLTVAWIQVLGEGRLGEVSVETSERSHLSLASPPSPTST